MADDKLKTSSSDRSLPCGSWPSPITPELAAGAAGTLDYPLYDGNYLYWVESRPDDNGRNTIMRMRRPDALSSGQNTQIKSTDAEHSESQKTIEEVLPSPLNARSRVHEYGGNPYTVYEGCLYFILQDDQRIYRIDLNRPARLPEALTTADQGLRFAELNIDSSRQRLIAVCEQHGDGAQEPENFIAAISLKGDQELTRIASGSDFYACPRLSPDQSTLAWISWQHPNMPWDNTVLKFAEFKADGCLSEEQKVTGKNSGNGNEESILQINWSADGSLFFVSDQTDWWNIYQAQAKDLSSPESTIKATPICPGQAEFATPLWTLGMSNYGISQHGIVALYTEDGLWHLGLIQSGKETSSHLPLHTIATPYSQLSSLRVGEHHAWFIASSPRHGSELVELDIEKQELTVLYQTGAPQLEQAYFSRPQALHYPTTNDDTAYGFYYPPTNPQHTALEGETPPLIALCHGGPTGATSTALSYKVQFWTSRGFAVADFNYRGSTGFGRKYRNKLHGNWGLSDVEDIVTGVTHLCEQKLADPKRLLIRGSSAGGYTVLAALTYSNVFQAGASLYGIGDLETLARDTHKFEARYLDSLVGPYPEARTIYIERSPIHHIEKLNCPVIFFQGLDDKVVPPNQALAMVDALKAKNLDVVYVPFAEEGHGFRKIENIARVFHEELAFYRRVLGIPGPPNTPTVKARTPQA